MTSFMQDGAFAKPSRALRPAVIGALSCGALMLSAGAAQANHMKMADGTMCPHAVGLPVPGEAPAVPGPERAGSTAPIGAAPSAAQPTRPASKSATKAPSQRAGAQAQASRPAATQAKTQSPAVATRPAANTVSASVAAPRQVPVARPSVAQQSRAERAKRGTASRAVSGPSVAPQVTTVLRGERAERPGAYAIVGARGTDSGISVPATIVLGLVSLLGLLVAAGVVAAHLRSRPTMHVTSASGVAESPDEAIERELQEMILEARMRALWAAGAVEGERDELELSQTH